MDDKNVGERLASIEALLSSSKEGQVRIERSLEKTSDELAARHAIQDKLRSEMQASLTKVDARSVADHLRINALELLVQSKIDKVDAVNKSEIEPLKEMLTRIDNHMNWAVKIVLGAVILALLSVVLVKAEVKAPWETPRAAVASVLAPQQPTVPQPSAP